MGKIGDFLAGIKVLEEVNSRENGRITVIKSIAFGTYFQVGGLTQSGGIIKDIWNKPLKKLSGTGFPAQNILVLGLGGGSIIEVIKKYWPDAKITAVDIDPVIVKLGRKYLGLNKSDAKIVISDAFDYLTSHNSKPNLQYDLVCVDLYVGDNYPEKFGSEKFARLLESAITKDGKAVINRLYYGEKRPLSVKFGKVLEKVFNDIQVIYPQANMMYICSN